MKPMKPTDFKCFGEGKAYQIPLIMNEVARLSWDEDGERAKKYIFTDDELALLDNKPTATDDIEPTIYTSIFIASLARWYHNSSDTKRYIRSSRQTLSNFDEIQRAIQNAKSFKDALEASYMLGAGYVPPETDMEDYDFNGMIALLYATEKSKLDNDTMLYSGLEVTPNINPNVTTSDTEVGDVFTIDTPLCTTTNLDTAIDFTMFRHSISNGIANSATKLSTVAALIANYESTRDSYIRTHGDDEFANASLHSGFADTVADIHSEWSKLKSAKRQHFDYDSDKTVQTRGYTCCFKLKKGDLALPSSIMYTKNKYGDYRIRTTVGKYDVYHPLASTNGFSGEREYTIPAGKFRVVKVDHKHRYIELEPIRDEV